MSSATHSPKRLSLLASWTLVTWTLSSRYLFASDTGIASLSSLKQIELPRRLSYLMPLLLLHRLQVLQQLHLRFNTTESEPAPVLIPIPHLKNSRLIK